jgi:hypothetical protein
MELFFPYFRLLEEGVEVDIAAPQKGHIHGEHGYGLDMLYKFFFSKFYKKSIATANQDCPPP